MEGGYGQVGGADAYSHVGQGGVFQKGKRYKITLDIIGHEGVDDPIWINNGGGSGVAGAFVRSFPIVNTGTVSMITPVVVWGTTLLISKGSNSRDNERWTKFDNVTCREVPFVISTGANTGQVTATVHQGAELGAGRISIEGQGARKALAFDGVGFSGDDGQHVSINGGMAFGGGALSLCAWVKWSDFGYYSRIFDIGNGPASDNIFLANHANTNTVVWRIYHGATYKYMHIANILQLDTWTHVCGTVEATTGQMHVYVDGVEKQCTGGGACVEGKGTDGWTPKRMRRRNAYIGRSNWDDNAYFNGSISDVNIIDGIAVT